jgi:hypothetical protein
MLSVGSVTVTANGGQTGDLLAAILAASKNYTVVTVGAGAASLPAAPTTSAGPFELVIQPGYTGLLDIPGGYALVVDGATADSNPITGGDSNTSIVGNGSEPLNYSGGAGVVLGAGGTGTVNDTAPGAMMSFTGNYSVTASGNNDTIGIGGGDVQVVVSGSNEHIDFGGGSASTGSGASAAATSVASVSTGEIAPGSTGDVASIASGQNVLLFSFEPYQLNQSGGSSTLVTGSGGVVTLNATGGSQLVFDFPGNPGNVINAGPSTEYVGAPNDTGTSFYNASAGGADTIFAISPVDYSSIAGMASSLFFSGGAGTATVSAAAAETVFSGAGGGTYSIGATTFDFAGGGGTDNLVGGAGAAPVLAFGNANENLTLTTGASGNTLIPFGNNDVMNASLAGGGNVWQIVNLEAGGAAAFAGNTTLTGSNAGGDFFNVYVDEAASTTPAAHTIDIANWQSSDFLILNDLGNGVSLTSVDAAAVAAFAGGTSHTLTLTDGTSIDFTGARPTSGSIIYLKS